MCLSPTLENSDWGTIINSNTGEPAERDCYVAGFVLLHTPSMGFGLLGQNAVDLSDLELPWCIQPSRVDPAGCQQSGHPPGHFFFYSDHSYPPLWAQRRWPLPREGDLITWSTDPSTPIVSAWFRHESIMQTWSMRLRGCLLNERRKVSLLSLNVVVWGHDAWLYGSHLAPWGHKSEGLKAEDGKMKRWGALGILHEIRALLK